MILRLGPLPSPSEKVFDAFLDAILEESESKGAANAPARTHMYWVFTITPYTLFGTPDTRDTSTRACTHTLTDSWAAKLATSDEDRRAFIRHSVDGFPQETISISH